MEQKEKAQKTVHLISNAHLDPVWQWEWEEGAAAALSTFRCAAQFCRAFDGYIFCHNESLLYRWVEEYEPALFEEIRALVAEGRWHIMGGWHLQPDCNMPSGESFVRQIEEGRRYFKEKFGICPTTAINFDPFGHTRGLVQLLAKSGYDSYLFCRPQEAFCHLPAEDFTWVGYDGSTVVAHRSQDGYNTGLGHAVDKMRGYVGALQASDTVSLCLWGVGDHGGGASRQDLRAIQAYKEECEKEGVLLIHSTPEAYFAHLRESGKPLPRHEGDLNIWSPGCYTSQARIKQKHRAVEALLYSCEKMCAQLAMSTDFSYPEKELGEALYDLLTSEFHDALPGSSVQGVEESTCRMLDHATEILTRVRMRAFAALCRGQAAPTEGEIPVFCYNPHPYAVENDFSCEFMLADQNWADTFTLPTVYTADGKPLPTQCEKEESNIPLDWRKRIVFHATLPPMAISRFDCRLKTLDKKPVPSLPTDADDTHFVFTSPRMQVRINRRTGLIDSVLADGRSYLRPGACALEVMQDNADPWGMTTDGWREKIGVFTLLSDEEATAFSDVEKPLEAIRVIEGGPVRTVLEAVFGYGSSRAVVRYLLSRLAPQIDLSVRLINQEKSKLIRLTLPCALSDPHPSLEVACGEEPMRNGGAECVGHRYLRVRGADGAMSILNRGIYGYSRNDGELHLTLLRAAGYTTHPIDGRKSLPQDRYSPHIDQGERLYPVRLLFGTDSSIARRAQSYNEEPFILSFFPDGDTKNAVNVPPAVLLEGDGEIIMTALKQARGGDGWILRLFNPQDCAASATLASPALAVCRSVRLAPYELQTLLLSNGKAEPCDLIDC